ncbi:DUF1439 domain-containing protein [Acidovorax sp. SRB_14]|uniref:DUF1439 domain-containing protein n=2 Tax=unclassified Acidovorax TaxID=2684926 RepID=UPI0020B10BFF|nr:DUF1439 domain-containing protein [Acidovorax sp. SRB_14]
MHWSAPSFPSRSALPRRHWLASAALGLALAATACTGPALPRSVTLSLETLQDKLAQRFPRSYPVAGLVELNLQAPRLALRPERNRINAVVALQAQGAALRRTYDGTLDLDFALRYEPSDHTVRAYELQVHALQFDGLPAQAAQLLSGLAPQLAQQALREVVLHQFQPKDLALADSLGLQPGRMTVTERGLVVELVSKQP